MVANAEGAEARRCQVRCLAWRSGRERVVSVRLPAAVDGTADEVLEVDQGEVRPEAAGCTPPRCGRCWA